SDGQGHQRQVVEVVVEQVHGAESTDKRNRHDYAGNKCGAPVPEKYKDNTDDQQDRDDHVPLGGENGSANRRRAVVVDLKVDGRRKRRAELREQGFDAIHRVDDVRVWLPIDLNHDGGLAACQTHIAYVLGPVNHAAEVGKPDRRVIAVHDDQVLIIFGVEELIGGEQGNPNVVVMQRTFGGDGVGAREKRPNLVQPDVVVGERLRIDLDTHGRQRASADTDLADPRHLGKLLRE